MRSSLTALCRDFEENREVIRKVFRWESPYIYPVCAAVFTDRRRRADEEQLRRCIDLLNEEVGIFSNFRGTSRAAVISLLCAGGNEEIRLKRMLEVYDLFKNYFFTSQYLPLTSAIVADMVPQQRYAEAAARTRTIYDLMKQEHPFLTAEEDSVFAALLALSPAEDEEIISWTERCYELLQEEFRPGNAVQSLSHALALAEGSPEEKCERTISLYRELKERGLRYGTGYELATLGVLSQLPADRETVADDVAETDQLLENIKGYGIFGMGKKQRLMHAAMLVTSDYLGKDFGMTMNSAAAGSVISLVAAQQAALCAAVAATSIAVASSASS